jgi:hypothetical protein
MQNWQYLVFKMGSDSLGDIQLTLEQLGNEGCELAAVVTDKEHGIVMYFKRPKS